MKALCADAKGDAHLLLSAAPWLVKVSAELGRPQELAVRGSFEWATDLLVASDGTLYVGGVAQTSGSMSQLQIQHLSATGELLGVASLNGARELGGIAQASDGVVRVATETDAGFSVGKLDGTQIVLDSRPLAQSWYTPLDSAARVFAAPSATNWAAAGAGERMWITFNGAKPSELEDFSTSSVGGLASDGSGGWYLAWADGWTNRYSGLGRFNLRLTRYGEHGQALWTKYSELNPTRRPETDEYYRTTGLVALSDSVVFTQASVVDAVTDRYASRYAKDGTLLDTVVGLEPVLLAAPAGPNSAVFMSSAHLYWVDFPKASITLRPDGAECAAAEFCKSGRCCVNAETQKGTCSSELCGFGATCLSARDCAGGKCLQPEGAATTPGVCTSSCTRSSDCPTVAFCVDAQCLNACSGTNCTLPNTQCTSEANAENIPVTVCTIVPPAVPPPPPKKADGQPCATQADCASDICCALDSTGVKECVRYAFDCKNDVGGQCVIDSNCLSNDCVISGYNVGWCTRDCATHQDCGSNPISGAPNACHVNEQGRSMCFAGCSHGDTTCQKYGTSVVCAGAPGPGPQCMGPTTETSLP